MSTKPPRVYKNTQHVIGMVIPISPEVCADVRDYLTRTGNQDLIEVLGLDQANRQPGHCGNCGQPLPLVRGKRQHADFCDLRCYRQSQAALATTS